MTALTIDVQLALIALALVTPRAYVCLVILPGFGTRTLVGIARNAVGMAIALPAALPTYLALQSDVRGSLLLFAAISLKEALVGAFIGVLLAIPIWVLQSVGSIFDMQRTPVQVQNVSPSIDQDASATGSVLLQAGVLVMIEAGLFLGLTRVMQESYGLWPVLSPLPAFLDVPMAEFLQRVGAFMGSVVVYTAPLLLPFLLVELAFAVVGTFAQGMQVSTLASPVKCVLGMAVLVMYWPTLAHFVAGDFSRQLDLVAAMLGAR
jgi:type III secretion protein T